MRGGRACAPQLALPLSLLCSLLCSHLAHLPDQGQPVLGIKQPGGGQGLARRRRGLVGGGGAARLGLLGGAAQQGWQAPAGWRDTGARGGGRAHASRQCAGDGRRVCVAAGGGPTRERPHRRRGDGWLAGKGWNVSWVGCAHTPSIGACKRTGYTYPRTLPARKEGRAGLEPARRPYSLFSLKWKQRLSPSPLSFFYLSVSTALWRTNYPILPP